MRPGSIKSLASAAVAAGVILTCTADLANGFGDEPGRLGRLFRMGGASASSTTKASIVDDSAPPAPKAPISGSNGQPALSTPPSTPIGSTSAMNSPRITPKPRVNRPITEADPLVSRVSLGRSDNGSQFGMLLQVFADGTIIDGEGVHRVNPDALKPLVEAISSGDFSRLKGHCGGPAGDFIENVHVVVFERSLGRLRASSFSYSGNPQGCDHAVHQLQKTLDELQGKLSENAPVVAPTAHNAPAPALGSPPLPLTSTP